MEAMVRNTVDREGLRARLRGLQRGGEITFAAVATQSGISRTAISQFVNSGLALRDEQVEAIQDALTVMDERGYTGAPIDAPTALSSDAPVRKARVELYQTQEYRDAMGWCEYVRTHRKMGVLIGYPGSGKTTVLRNFLARVPGAHYVECWPGMRMGDLLAAIAQAADVALTGNNYHKALQLISALKARDDIMLLFDEAEYLRKWDVDKFEVIRKFWDNTGTPVIFAGTHELENILTRGASGNGRGNLAQLYRRKLEIRLTGIKADEVLAILRDYSITPEAAEALARVAVDAKHGGMGNFVEILDMCLATAAGGEIDLKVVEGAKQFKLLY